MNSPVIIALIATIVTVVLFYLATTITGKYMKGIAQIGAMILGILTAGAISSDAMVSAKSGEYFFYMLIAFAIGSKVLGKSKSKENA